MNKSISILLTLLFAIAIVISSCKKDDTPCTETTWYQDVDGDGLGNPDVSQSACEQPAGYVSDNSDTEDAESDNIVKDVDGSLFLTDDGYVTVETVPCTLSNGVETDCYQIISTNIPTDHEMGPWCPSHISDSAEEGGIWIDNGEAYDVDGAFLEGLADFYNDSTWKMYDDDGNIYKIETEEDCLIAADPQAGDVFKNYCVQCLPGWVTEVQETFLIPITPIKLDASVEFSENAGPPGGGMQNTSPVTRGIAFNGVKYDGPAAVDIILSTFNIAPIDDAGGHINNAVGYHYHGDGGFSTRIEQADNHAAMIGYALDGHAIYAELDADGNEATDLDECRGHYDEIRGYHYHGASLGTNNFINCLYGAYAN